MLFLRYAPHSMPCILNLPSHYRDTRVLTHMSVLCRVVVLEDNDVVHLRRGAYGIFNALVTEKERHCAVPRALETLNMEVSQIMKGGYDTFMQARP